MFAGFCTNPPPPSSEGSQVKATGAVVSVLLLLLLLLLLLYLFLFFLFNLLCSLCFVRAGLVEDERWGCDLVGFGAEAGLCESVCEGECDSEGFCCCCWIVRREWAAVLGDVC